jgi:hypothetical protein
MRVSRAQVAVDFFLNASQCEMNHDIWHDDEDSTLSWFVDPLPRAQNPNARSSHGILGLQILKIMCRIGHTSVPVPSTQPIAISDPEAWRPSISYNLEPQVSKPKPES